MEKIDLLWELEGAEANLSDDIQALAYIQDDLETAKKEDILLLVPQLKNQVQTLLKSMLYNQDNMKQIIEKAYEEKKAKEGVN